MHPRVCDKGVLLDTGTTRSQHELACSSYLLSCLSLLCIICDSTI